MYNSIHNAICIRRMNVSLFIVYLQKTLRNRNAPAKLQAASIFVYDVSNLLTVSKKLAENYIVDSNNVAGKVH